MVLKTCLGMAIAFVFTTQISYAGEKKSNPPKGRNPAQTLAIECKVVDLEKRPLKETIIPISLGVAPYSLDLDQDGVEVFRDKSGAIWVAIEIAGLKITGNPLRINSPMSWTSISCSPIQ